MRVTEHRQPVRLHFQHGIERFVERLRCLVRQAVDEVEVDGAVAQLAHPIHGLLRHFARLDAMDGFLDFRVEILHAHRGAVETDFAQRGHVLAREPARVHFHARFDVRRKREVFADDIAEPADFVGLQKSRRTARRSGVARLFAADSTAAPSPPPRGQGNPRRPCLGRG